MASWLEQVATTQIPRAATAAGISAGRGKSWGPCPACGAAARGSGDDRLPLGLTSDGKGWACHVSGCGAEGDLADLLAYQHFGKRCREITAEQRTELRKITGQAGLWVDANPHNLVDAMAMIRRSPANTASAPAPVEPGPVETKGPFAWRQTLLVGAHLFLFDGSAESRPIMEYLRAGRGFSEEVIRSWGLGGMVCKDKGGKKIVERYVVIPLNDDQGTPVNAKFRSVPGPCLYCSTDGLANGPGCDKCKKSKDGPGTAPKVYRCCAGRPLPLFGADQLVPGPVIVVEGELDVIAADEYGWAQNVVSGTAGAGQDWPDEWLDRLEAHPHFTLAFDNDKAGNDGAAKLADKLGKYRCSRARLPLKDIGDCLAAGIPTADVKAALDAALAMVGLELVDPDVYAAEIEALIKNPTKLIGVQCSVQAINEAIGGLTPGLHVFSGETGSGKTTLSTFLLWDYATLGHPVLLTSFEQQPIGTVMKLLRIEMGGDFTKRTEPERLQALRSLVAKKIKICAKYGDTTDADVIDTVRYARRRRGIRIAMIDHLDYIVRVRQKGEDEREAKERVCRELAVIGVQDDICIILVVHPNNQASNAGRRVGMGDLKGASAIRQEASSVTIIEVAPATNARPFTASSLYFDKVRSEFGTGSGTSRLLAFDPASLHFAARWEDTPSGKAGHRIIIP